MPTPTPSLLTISQAAKYLGVSADTLRNWDESGKLRSIRTDGNQRRYYLSEISAFQNTPLKYQRQIVIPDPASSSAQYVTSLLEKTPTSSAGLYPQVPTIPQEFNPTEITSPYIPPELRRPAFQFSLLHGKYLNAFLIILLVCFTLVGLDRFGILQRISFFSPASTSTSPLGLLTLPGEIDSTVLAATANKDMTLAFDLPMHFKRLVTFDENVFGSGDATFSGTLSVGGQLIAPNIITSLTANTGIQVTPGQTPAITNTDPGSAQKFFAKFKVSSQDDVSAGANADTITLAAGSGISLSTNSSDKKITITNSSLSPSTPYSISNGGTGLSVYTVGDILYASATTTLSRLAIGSTNQVLAVSGGLPSWASTSSLISGTTSEDFLINTDYTGLDNQSSTLSFERGSSAINAQLKWRALDSPLPNQLFSLNAPLMIEQDSGINFSGTSALIVNQIQSQDILTASASGVTRFVLTNAGNITSGTYNNQTISANANFSGSLTVANNFIVSSGTITTPLISGALYSNGGIITSEAQLAISHGGTNTNSLPTTGSLAYGTGTAYGFTSVGTGGQVLISQGTSAPAWVDPGTAGINYWTLSSNSLSPYTSTNHLSLGGSAITSHVLGVSAAATGQALVGLNETGNQNILTASASGATVFSLSRTGSLIFNPGGSANATTLSVTTPTGPNSITLPNISGEISLLGQTISGSEMDNDTVSEVKLNVSNGPTDNYVLSYSSGSLIWTNPLSGSGSSKWTDAGNFTYLSNVTNSLAVGGSTAATAAFYFDTATGNISFEGSTADNFETTLTLTNPTADNTITIPNLSGEISLLGQTIEGTEIAGNTITESNLNVTNGPTAGYVLSYDSGGGFTWITNDGGTGASKWQINTSTLSPLDSSQKLSLGGLTTSPSIFQVSGKSTGQALAVFNETGDSDILTASASGVTKFTVSRTGNLIATGTITGLTGITTSGTITNTGLATGVLYSNSGVLTSETQLAIGRGGTNGTATPTTGALAYGTGTAYAFTAAGTSGQVLLSTGTDAPIWVNSAIVGTNYFQHNSTTISPLTSSDHIALGGITTTSHVFGVSGAATGQSLVNLNEIGDQAILTASASGVTKFTLDRSGNITSATWNGTTIGYQYGGTGGTATPTQGGISYGTSTAYAFSAAGTSGQLLQSNGTSAPTWVNNPGNYWQLNSTTLAPATLTQNMVLGGATTTNHKLEVNGAATGKALVSLNETGNQDILSASASGTNVFRLDRTGKVFGTAGDFSSSTLSTDNLLNVSSTSTALTTGRLAYLNWDPSSPVTAATDLFSLNIGSQGTVNNLLNITDNGTSLFRVSETQIESAIPHAFTAVGDVSVAYDIAFTNQTASYIKSNSALSIESGEAFESNNLTLKTYNSGNVVLDLPASGAIISLQTYSNTVGTTNRDLYIDDTGKIGYVSSSIRYKENVATLDNIDWLYSLNPVNFTYKNDPLHLTQFGLIAEEVEAVNPLLVSYNKLGEPETVSYDKLISPLLAAVKQQHDAIASISAQLAHLELTAPPTTVDQDLNSSIWLLSSDASGRDLVSTIHPIQVPQLTVAGKLSVGLITIDDLAASISSLTGKITVTGDLGVSGVLTAQTISASVIETEHLKVLGSATIGTGTLLSGLTEIVIAAPAVSSQSAVFVTPQTVTAYPLSVTASTPSASFKVETAQAQDKDIPFRWWIVN